MENVMTTKAVISQSQSLDRKKLFFSCEQFLQLLESIFIGLYFR